jgi:hypothetical protein
MTTMTTKTLRVALATAFLMMGAASVGAQTTSRIGNSVEIRVVNNHASAVLVYAEDRFGRTEPLGWVNHSDARTLTIPATMTRLGPVQITVYSNRAVESVRSETEGVQTRSLNLRPGDVVNVWLQTELKDSYIQLVRI